MAAADPAALKMLGVPVLVLALLLTGCGPANTAAPSTPSTPSTAAPTPAAPASLAPTSTSTSTSTEAAASRSASGPSFGVDRADWPDTEKGAKALLASLPEELGGEPVELGDPRDHAPGADFGTLGTVSVQTEEDQEGPDRLTAQQLLLAGFGLGGICAEGTYRGTAAVPVIREGEEEGALSPAAPGVQDGSTPAWFSCQPITEDEEWGHAVGWTSGRTAWQLYARDEQAARTLVTALHEAAADPAAR